MSTGRFFFIVHGCATAPASRSTQGVGASATTAVPPCRKTHPQHALAGFHEEARAGRENNFFYQNQNKVISKTVCRSSLLSLSLRTSFTFLSCFFSHGLIFQISLSRNYACASPHTRKNKTWSQSPTCARARRAARRRDNLNLCWSSLRYTLNASSEHQTAAGDSFHTRPPPRPPWRRMADMSWIDHDHDHDHDNSSAYALTRFAGG